MGDDALATPLPSCDKVERALILFLPFIAARASEVCRVMSDHIDWEGCTVLLPQTTGDPRQVALPDLVYEALLHLRGQNPLFGCNNRWALNRRLTAACKRAGLPPRITSHKIGRHSLLRGS
jgi:integrase